MSTSANPFERERFRITEQYQLEIREALARFHAALEYLQERCPHDTVGDDMEGENYILLRCYLCHKVLR